LQQSGTQRNTNGMNFRINLVNETIASDIDAFSSTEIFRSKDIYR